MSGSWFTFTAVQRRIIYPFIVSVAVLISFIAYGQETIGRRMQQTVGGIRRATTSGTTDSLRKRNKLEDSITISFRYLDSTGSYKLDSSIQDFYRRFPVPADYIHLGNTGTAARSLLFSPVLKAGFDPGFHAFSIYEWKMEKARFFQTTRPYSELNYLLGSRVEQVIELLHTQNIRPSWNISFNYRLVNAPGFFQNQKSNHNNYQVTSRYQGPKLRYTAYFALVANKIQAGENGGIIDTTNILKNPIYKQRYNINTYLGGSNPFSTNFFTNKLITGNQYGEFNVLYRHQYDLGKKDSLVTDSTVIPLFYPRLRFEHTIELVQNNYRYMDLRADTPYYRRFYDTVPNTGSASFELHERWQILSNDFSIYQFPDAKNLHQFIKLGITLQSIAGDLSSGHKSFVNTMGHAEYRNRSRNQVWDIEALGRFFFTGFNAADFDVHAAIQRSLGKKLGFLKLGFENASRTPSFIFDSRSSFYLMKNPVAFKKENNSHLYATYGLPSFGLTLSGHYYLATNYTYITDYFRLKQETSLFNLLQIAASKAFRLHRHWVWHADLYFQQKIGNAPVNVPTIYSRNRIGYEGNLGFRNLDIAMGLEIRYRSPYKADNYSPLLGQYFFQDSITISNPRPDITAYVHFRIRSFKAFVRAENLNTAQNLDGFSFTKNNLLAPGYPLPGLQIRLGVYWGFVN